jgi:hypothetical protein
LVFSIWNASGMVLEFAPSMHVDMITRLKTPP